jgi:hypothetical protein
MSIDCSDGEPVEVYNENIKRAKKDWECDACRQRIERGHLYHETKMFFDDVWEVTRRCARCEALFRFLVPCVRELSSEERCAEALDCGHEWKDNFEGEPPVAVQALAFLTPAEAQVLIRRPPPTTLDVLFGPEETDEHRIARLLAMLFGDRIPVPTDKFIAVEREDREY